MVSLSPVELTDLRPIRDIVYDSLREAIVKGRLAAGERLVESQLAEQLGVSRTPVREALRMLEQDGMAVAIPRRGTVVAGLKREDAIEIYNIRAVLEGLAARLAAVSITPEEISQLRGLLEQLNPALSGGEHYMKVHAQFNQILIRASRSPRIAQLLDTFSGQLGSLRGISLTTPERRMQAWKEHNAIVDALENRDSDLAEVLAKKHVENAKSAFMAQMK